MSGRRVQPPRTAKAKPAPVAPVSPGAVAKRTQRKKPTAKDRAASAKKKTGPAKKRRAPETTRSKRKAKGKGTVDEETSDDGVEGAAGSGQQEGPAEQAEGTGAEDADADEDAARSDDDVAQDARIEPLDALATSEVRRACTFKGNAAELVASLKVFSHPGDVSRLGYYAKLRLTVSGSGATGAAIDGRTVGFVLAWRISKPTLALPNTTNAWLQEILNNVAMNPDMNETYLCVSALFDQNGIARPAVGTHTDQLTQNPLLFIEMIYTHEEFQQSGLLRPTLDCFNSALAELPEWFAFTGTLVLIPARPDPPRAESWGKVSDRTVENRLVEIYGRRGYQLWFRDARVGDNLVTVMGRTLP